MESSGVPSRIQVTAATRRLLDDRFDWEERGVVEIKGKGPMPVFLVASR
jgi:class 3 adenylate cyclase